MHLPISMSNMKWVALRPLGCNCNGTCVHDVIVAMHVIYVDLLGCPDLSSRPRTKPDAAQDLRVNHVTRNTRTGVWNLWGFASPELEHDRCVYHVIDVWTPF